MAKGKVQGDNSGGQGTVVVDHSNDPNLDPNNPLAYPLIQTPELAVIGQNGLKQYGGFVVDDLLPELTGPRGRMKFRQMADNDPTVGAVLYAITSLFRGVEWSFEPSDDSPAAVEEAEFIEGLFDDMEHSRAEFMAEVATMFVYGFSLHEILFKRRCGPDKESPEERSKFSDNLIGIRALPLRKQATIWEWRINNATGTILGAVQQPINGPKVTIPISKCLLFRVTPEGNNPEGRSVLRNAYRPWYFKSRIEEIEAIGVERDLAGLPVAKIPSEVMASVPGTPEHANYLAWQKLVQNIKSDKQQGIVIPSDRDQNGNALYELTLLSTAGSRTFDTTKIVDRYDRQIATSVLADFIFLGQNSVGSFALSSDKTALFSQALMCFILGVFGVLNSDLIPLMMLVNGKSPDLKPKVSPSDLESLDLGQITSMLSTMANAGAQVFPDRDLENALRKRAGLPMVPENRDDMAGDQGFTDDDDELDGESDDGEGNQGGNS